MARIQSIGWFWVLLLLVGFSACDMEQEIEVQLPVLPPELVVECYLEEGKPIRLALSETSGYFEGAQPVVVNNATVTITKNNSLVIPLRFSVEVDNKNEKVTNYQSRHVINSQPGDVYTLTITDPKGRKLTGFTTVLPPAPLDSVGYKFNDKPTESQEAYLFIRWQDDPTRENYYRLLAHKNDSTGVESEMDAEINDRLRNGEKITYTTTYRFERGDTLNIKLFHIDKAYYEFISSVEDARRSNGNPFAQPVSIKPTVTGGFGVFTHLNYASKELIIK
ncbi:DUF4249 family protein [Nibribacter ruber]|uniref:DUF4249 family protein n=1 Tax=Nibribacter ruber TaxID=2698458 RepID=A0A6P1P1D0_9BACT|nr:DUF4249 domain-containing protein [Nibribacter ruber]QHL87042.1 DUF4249 family protein [Nibribacter ruber]